MDSTPIVRSGGFPRTPAPSQRRRGNERPPSANSTSSSKPSSTLPLASEGRPKPSRTTQSVIPLALLDAPTQRSYAFLVYVLLCSWKIYDWIWLVEDGTESFWLFMKWIAIDFIFLFGLPELRIPWLELSQPLVVAIFLLHFVFDYFLMFSIPVCPSRQSYHMN